MSLQQTMKQIQDLLKSQKWKEVLEVCEAAQSKGGLKPDATQNLILCQAQANIELENFNEAQKYLNDIYQSTNMDGPLYYRALQFQDKYFDALLNSPQTSNNQKKELKLDKISNMFKKLEFLEKKQKWDTLLSEVETYIAMLKEFDKYIDIEETYIWLYGITGLTNEQRQHFGARIFTIDPHYKPKQVNLFKMFEELNQLSPGAPCMLDLAQKMSAQLEKGANPKDITTAIKSDRVQEYINVYAKNLCMAGHYIFNVAEPKNFLGSSLNLRVFARFISCTALTVQFDTEAWANFVQLMKLTINDVFTKQNIEASTTDQEVKDIAAYTRIYMQSFELITQVIQSGTFDAYVAAQSETFTTEEELEQNLKSFQLHLQNYSPFVNIHFAFTLLTAFETKAAIITAEKLRTIAGRLATAEWLILRINNEKINKSYTNLHMMIHIARFRLLKYATQTDDGNARIPELITMGEQKEVQEKCKSSFAKLKNIVSKECISLYETCSSEYNWLLAAVQGNWQEALNELEKIQELGICTQSDWFDMKRAWIQYSFIDQLASTKEEKITFLQGICTTLQKVQKENPKNAQALLFHGMIIFQHAEDLGIPVKQAQLKWLQSLKQDQTNAETFYSIGLYSFLVDNDAVKAQKCLDKALLLRKNFEQAFLLQFHLLVQDGKIEKALELLDAVQQENRNLASTYFLRGVLMQNKKQYILALDNFFNVSKFFKSSKSVQQQKSLCAMCPQLSQTQCVEKMPLFASQKYLGIFGGQRSINVWIHQTECFLRIGKIQAAEKCFLKVLVELDQVIEETVGKDLEAHVQKQVSSDPIMNELRKNCLFTVNFEGGPTIDSKSGMRENLAFEKLKKLVHCKEGPSKYKNLIRESLEAVIMGAQVVSKPQNSLLLSILSLDMIEQLEIFNVGNLKDRCVSLILQKLLLMSTTKILEIQNSLSNMYSSESCLPHAHFDLMRQICEISIKEGQNPSIALKREVINVFFTIGKHKQDASFLGKAAELGQTILDSMLQNNEFQNGAFKKSLMLDTAKCYHLLDQLKKNEENYMKKMTLINQLLVSEPGKSDLWIFFSAFTRDKKVKDRAIFKAYELEPRSPFVQEHIIKLYFRKQQYSRAFKVIVDSIAQKTKDEITQRSMTMDPIIQAFLAYLNAHVGLLDTSLSIVNRQQKISEALNLIQTINTGGLRKLFSELYFFLMQENGSSQSYLQTQKVLETLVKAGEEKNSHLQLMLVQAIFGSQVFSYSQGKESAEKIFSQLNEQGPSEQISQVKGYLDFIVNLEMVPTQAIKNETLKAMDEFIKYSPLFSYKLALLQELCLNKNILPLPKGQTEVQTILDLPGGRQALQNVDSETQKILTVQSLRFCQLRDKKIKTAEDTKSADEHKNYQKFMDDIAQAKPSYLDSALHHKRLLELFLQAQTDPGTVERAISVSKWIQTKHNIAKAGLGHKTALESISALKQEQNRRLTHCQKGLLMNPTCLASNVQWVWSLIRQGRTADALKAFNLVKQRINAGIILGAEKASQESSQFSELQSFTEGLQGVLHQFGNSQALDDRLSIVASLYHQVQNRPQKTGSQIPETKELQLTAVTLIKIIVSTDDDHKQSIISSLFNLMQGLLLNQGYLFAFNLLIDYLLQLSTAMYNHHYAINQVTKTHEDQFDMPIGKSHLNEFWLYKILHMGSSFIDMKKNARAMKEINEAETVLSQGFMKRNTLPATLLKIRAYYELENWNSFNQEISKLSATEEISIEKDFLAALYEYSKQNYREFYLCSLGLVASCKVILSQKQESSEVQLASQITQYRKQKYMNLAYALYLKGLAESVLWNARRLKKDLPEDLQGEQYTVEYFHRKAQKSLIKARSTLLKSGLSDSNTDKNESMLLYNSIGEMIDNMNN